MGLAILTAVIVLPLTVPLMGPEALAFWSEDASMFLLLLAGLGTTNWARQRASERPERRFWLLVAMSLGAVLAVRILYVADGDPALDLPSLPLDPAWSDATADALYVTFYALLVAAVHLRPDRRMSEVVAETKGLEVAAAGTFILALVAYYLVIPAVWTPWLIRSWAPSLLLYGTLDVYLLTGFLYLAATAGSREWRSVFGLLSGAAAIWFVTDVVEALSYLEVVAWWDSGNPLDVFWFAPYALVALAAGWRTGGGDPLAPPVPRGANRVAMVAGYTLILAGLHLVLNVAGVVDPAVDRPRAILVLASLPVFLGVAHRLERSVSRRIMELDREGKRLERQRALLAAALEQTTEAVLLVRPDGAIDYINPAGTRQGTDPSTWAVGSALPEVVQGADPHAAHQIRVALATGEAWEGRAAVPTGEGGTGERHLSISPVRFGGGEVELYAVLLRDISREVELEGRIQQGQRLEALGTLAGGVAHEFNNVLAAILGFAELVREDMVERGDGTSDVDAMIHAAERGRILTTQILAFSRRQQATRGSVRLGEVVEEAARLLRATLPSTVVMDLETRPELGPVWADVGQLHQTVMNLGSNASHAMKGHGTIRIRVRETRLANQRVPGLTAGPYAVLSVSDDGTGMDPVTAARAFEPFFTTKPRGAGTGLGLSVVHGIVAGHGGAIDVESAPGKGSTFSVFLPLWRPDTATDSAASDTPSSPRVLLLEPDREAGAVACRMMERAGFTCRAFHDVDEAFHVLGSEPWDVLVADDAFPGTPGLELARRARSLSAELRIVLTTGSLAGVPMEMARNAGVGEVVAKPYSAPSLAQGIRTSLAIPLPS